MKFIDSLFRPKLIGKYINEHIVHSLVYILFFVILCSIPSISSVINSDELNINNQSSLIYSIKNSNDVNISIVDNKLNTTNNTFVFNGDSVSIAFNTIEVSNALVYVFSENTYTMYYQGSKVTTINYSDLSNSNLVLSDIADGDIKMIYRLLDILNVGYNYLLDNIVSYYCFQTILDIIIEFAIIIVILVVIGARFNRSIPWKFRLRVAIYASTWAYILYFISVICNISWLYYIGIVVAFIFNARSLRNLIKIERRPL